MRTTLLRTSLFGFIFCLIANISNAASGVVEHPPMPNPGWPGHDLNGTQCLDKGKGYGPYDYTNPKYRGYSLNIVEEFHFTKDVENLKKGSSSYVWADLEYTIMAFPNHHRALYAMMRYQLSVKRPLDARYSPIECYFQRAMKFTPNDYRVMQLYANYLVKKKHPKLAINIYKRALSIPDAPAQINYSLGLLYFDLKKFDNAVEQAKIAYGNGVKKSKLARKLKEVNRWPVQ